MLWYTFRSTTSSSAWTNINLKFWYKNIDLKKLKTKFFEIITKSYKYWTDTWNNRIYKLLCTNKGLKYTNYKLHSAQSNTRDIQEMLHTEVDGQEIRHCCSEANKYISQWTLLLTIVQLWFVLCDMYSLWYSPSLCLVLTV